MRQSESRPGKPGGQPARMEPTNQIRHHFTPLSRGFDSLHPAKYEQQDANWKLTGSSASGSLVPVRMSIMKSAQVVERSPARRVPYLPLAGLVMFAAISSLRAAAPR